MISNFVADGSWVEFHLASFIMDSWFICKSLTRRTSIVSEESMVGLYGKIENYKISWGFGFNRFS
jgi:hypothetical protein